MKIWIQEITWEMGEKLITEKNFNWKNDEKLIIVPENWCEI